MKLTVATLLALASLATAEPSRSTDPKSGYEIGARVGGYGFRREGDPRPGEGWTECRMNGFGVFGGRLLQGPLFVEARTHLWPGNAFNMPKLVGGTTNIAWAWDASKAPEKVRDWHKDHDPSLNYVRELAGSGIGRGELEKLDAEVSQETDAAARFALESPLPGAKAALNYAFAGKGN